MVHGVGVFFIFVFFNDRDDVEKSADVDQGKGVDLESCCCSFSCVSSLVDQFSTPKVVD